MRALWILLLTPLLLGADDGVREVLDCMERNAPEKSLVQTVEFTCVDRTETRITAGAHMATKRLDDGLHRSLTAFTAPESLRGVRYLFHEATGRSPDMWFFSPEIRKVKRLTGTGACKRVGCTDFSCDDLARFQGIKSPETSKLLADTLVADRPVYVIESRPTGESASIYERVVTFADRETCVALRTESYEPGDKLRKVLSADPADLTQRGERWFASRLLMEDSQEKTHTFVEVIEIALDQDVGNKCFSQSQLERGTESCFRAPKVRSE